MENIHVVSIDPDVPPYVIIMGYRTPGLTHLLGRQGKHVWLIVRQLPKTSWWDAPLALQDLAEAICMYTKI